MAGLTTTKQKNKINTTHCINIFKKKNISINLGKAFFKKTNPVFIDYKKENSIP